MPVNSTAYQHGNHGAGVFNSEIAHPIYGAISRFERPITQLFDVAIQLIFLEKFS